MALILTVLGSEGGKLADVARRLRRAGHDVCAAPHDEPGGLRESVLHTLAMHADLVVAAWGRSDLSAPWYVETLGNAARAGKLLGASVDGSALPALSDFAGFTRCPTLNELTHQALARAPETGRTSSALSLEYAAFRRAAATGDANAWRRFLRRHTRGVFAELARTELELAATPVYQSPSGPGLEGERVQSSWRLQRQGSSAWLASAAIGFAAIAAVVTFGFMGRPEGALPQPLPHSPSPAAASAARLQWSASTALDTPATIDGPLEADEPITEFVASLGAAEPIAASVALEAPELVPSAAATSVAVPASPAPAQPVALRGASAFAHPFDVSRLPAASRALVEQARRRQAYAEQEAGRSERSRTIRQGGLEGRYSGDWGGSGPSGLGAATFSNGDRYVGSWSGSAPDGLGVLQLASGVRYEGEFDNGAPTGRGVFWGADGRPLGDNEAFRTLMLARAGTAGED